MSAGHWAEMHKYGAISDAEYLAGPPRHCEHPMSRGTACLLDKGHRGRHSTVVFRCDICDKTRRGRPHSFSRDTDGAADAAFCFMCARELV